MGTVVALNISENSVTEVCCECGGVFAIPQTLYKKLYRDHSWFYCPMGHVQHYTGKSEELKLREKLRSMELDRDGWRRQEEKRTRQLSAARGVNTKLRKRVSAGVCPCCKRSFQNLKSHMAKKHPKFGTE